MPMTNEKSGYRGETLCTHGIGHGDHVHGCDGCCTPGEVLEKPMCDCPYIKGAHELGIAGCHHDTQPPVEAGESVAEATKIILDKYSQTFTDLARHDRKAGDTLTLGEQRQYRRGFEDGQAAYQQPDKIEELSQVKSVGHDNATTLLCGVNVDDIFSKINELVRAVNQLRTLLEGKKEV